MDVRAGIYLFELYLFLLNIWLEKNSVSNFRLILHMIDLFFLLKILIIQKEIANNSGNNQTESFKVIDDLNDNFDDEAKHLYMWTKNLSISDL